MKSLFIIISFTASACTFCNAQYMQIVPGNIGLYDKVNTNDLLLLSQSEPDNNTNADISGNPFWDEDWKTAILYTYNQAILIQKVKLNLYTNDVWYTATDSLVMIAKRGAVKGITFFKGNDTTDILANFVYLKKADGNNYCYYQFMNAGKAQLVQLTSVTVNKKPFNPFTGKAEQNYVTQTESYLYYNSTMNLLKGTNKEAIFNILQPNDASKEWLDKNKNKLKSKPDILLFLNYFNTQNR